MEALRSPLRDILLDREADFLKMALKKGHRGLLRKENNMSEVLVVQSKVKEYIKGKGCQTSADAIDALSKKVTDLLNDAVERAKSNGRSTVKDRDV